MSTTAVETWRRRPNVRAEGMETSGMGFADTPTPRWHMWGKYVEIDMLRVMQGLICIRCFQPFPERLGYSSARRIIRECGPFMRPLHEVKALVQAGHCPYCSTEVSPEMAAMFFAGNVTRSVEAPAVLQPGDHEGYEDLIKRGSKSKLYLPPGVRLG